MPVTDSNRVSPINHVPNLLCQFSEVFRAFACVLTGKPFSVSPANEWGKKGVYDSCSTEND